MLVSTNPASTYIPGEMPNLSLSLSRRSSMYSLNSLSMPLVQQEKIESTPEPLLLPQPEAELEWLDPLVQYMQEEYRKISLAVDRALVREVEWLRTEPSKPRDGMIRGADGTLWNPGGGQGIYCYYNGAWNRLIEIATAATIADGSVTEPKIASNAVTSAKLVDGSVLTAKLADLAVTLAKLGSGAVDTSKLSDGAVTAIKILDGSITLDKHSTGLRPVQVGTPLPTLPDANYPAGAVFFLTTDLKLYRSDGSVWTRAVDGGDITASTITAGAIAAGAIGTDALAANSVVAAKIAAGEIQTTHLAAQAVTAAKIAAATITTNEIAASTILAGNIAALTITANELASNAVTTDKLNANAVTAAKIAANTITASQIAANTITAGQIAAGTITATEIAASTITGAKIAANTITASNIAALTITAAEIAASTITAAKLTISTLSAITADMGSLTAGTIALASSGHIRAGQTAYHTGTGFFLGFDGATPKFSIGNSSGQYVTWNGSVLSINGEVKDLRSYATGTIAIVSSLRERSQIPGASYVKTIEVYMARGGTVTVEFDLHAAGDGTTAYGRIYKNGVATGTERSTTLLAWQSYSENISVSAADLLQLYIKQSTAGSTNFIRNFRVKNSFYIAETITQEVV